MRCGRYLSRAPGLIDAEGADNVLMEAACGVEGQVVTQGATNSGRSDIADALAPSLFAEIVADTPLPN